MDDLISRKMVLALPRNKVRNLRTYEVIEETINVTDIEHLPSVQPERKTGKWMPDATGWEFCCSECGYSVMFGGEANTFKYCPECGAKMEETE